MSIFSLADRALGRFPGRVYRCWRDYGFRTLLGKVANYPAKRLGWILPKPLSRKASLAWQETFSRQPLVSIVVPVYRTPRAWLDACVKSVQKQHYPHWELILVDDASGDESFTKRLEQHTATDSRIRVVTLSENAGIAGATNAGIEHANGEFVGFLDHDDELTPDALTWVVAAHNRHPDARWFYSDEDKIPDTGRWRRQYGHYFKPAFSAATLLSSMYTCHFSVYSREILDRVGGLRLGFDGAQDHDLVLRLSEVVDRHDVVHIPRVLYHWRAVDGSTAADQNAKPLASVNGQKAVRDALKRRGISAEVSAHPKSPTSYRITFHKTDSQDKKPVRILIPTFNALEDLRTCLDSIEKRTRYSNYRVTVIDNRSNDPAVLAFLEQRISEGRIDVVRDPKPFNHSRMHNDVIADCEDEHIVMMNNDVELLADGWLTQLMGSLEMDASIAGVGALLLYPDRTIQHGGIYMGRFGVAGHAFAGLDEQEMGYFAQAQLLRETSGATAALLLIRRSAFLAVNGFDAETFPTSFNDVDLWMRLCQRGYRCLYDPQVLAIHYESKTRKPSESHDRLYALQFHKRWGEAAMRDPFHHPNLDLMNTHCGSFAEFRDLRDPMEIFRRLPRVPHATGTAEKTGGLNRTDPSSALRAPSPLGRRKREVSYPPSGRLLR